MFLDELMNPIKLSEIVIKACYEVHNELGTGFVEKIYENALSIAFSEMDVDHTQQARISVRFRGHVVGEYLADLLIDNELLVELKACASLKKDHKAQLINYLKATGIKDGLLINFAVPGLEIRRAYFKT